MTAAEPTGIQVVVFDIDGTLLDSATGILAGFGVALAAGGVPVPDEPFPRTNEREEFWQRIADSAPAPATQGAA